MTQNAAVSSKLSTRARNLSQRRNNKSRSNTGGEGVDLSGQDQSMKDRESGLWVPAGAHREYQDDEEEEEEEEEAPANGQGRGREEERAVEA